MSYTLKNLRDTTDSAPRFGYGEIGEAHFAREELDAEATGLAYVVLRPGKRQAFGHSHDRAEEIYVVLSGGGRVRLDDEIVEISSLDAIRVAPNVKRAFEAGAAGLELLAFGAHHANDGALDMEFWKD